MCFPGVSLAKNSPANEEIPGDSGMIPGLGRSLEEKMAKYFNVLAGIIPWTEEPGGLQSMGSQRVTHDCVTQHMHTQVLSMEFAMGIGKTAHEPMVLASGLCLMYFNTKQFLLFHSFMKCYL